MDYSRIINVIKESDFVEFADYGDGIADEWIYKAETRLGLKLPDSYKWWLKCYSGGEISGEEIYSIYEMDFDSVRGGDIVYMSIVNGRNGCVGRRGYLSVNRRVQGNHFILPRTMVLMMGSILFTGLIFLIKLLVCMRKILSIS
ncbi:SMI1/KNR4 family protein [Pseudomonas sp. B21-010]|uniref:SMI1/KNR4 family protein n=1 Tax=Pseudomonas sp. B21-010 TaxID=2895471 RepID=UPI00215E27C4|nr:SMI1/KNR4 family protein [Pseudomonas sp. B21-010]UVM62189.1 SMI1/KNR4 family protein [Pseudomonas sp. B21-010]